MSIHVYGQPFHHADVFIVGTPDELKELVGAINSALTGGVTPVETFTDDGEGYCIKVISTNNEVMERLRLPYHDDMAIDNRPHVIEPWQIPLLNSTRTDEDA